MGRHARQERHVPAFVQALMEAIPPRGAEAMFAPTTPIDRPARVIDLRDPVPDAVAGRGHGFGVGA